MNITPPALETIITGLRQQAAYSFRILAATSKGDGPWSDVKENDTLGKSDIKCGLVITKCECSILSRSLKLNENRVDV